MSRWGVTLELSGEVYVEVDAADQDEADEKARWAWNSSDAELEVEHTQEIYCLSRDTLERLTDEEHELVELIADNTDRQLRMLFERGYRHALYAVPDDITDPDVRDVVNDEVEQRVRDIARFAKRGNRVYLEAVGS